MTPEYALYRVIYAMAMDVIGDNHVVTSLTDAEESYPLIFIRELVNDDESNSDLMGTIRVHLDVYGTKYDINVLDEIKVDLNNRLIRLSEAFNYNMRLMDLSMTTREESTDRQTLSRVLVLADFQYTKKER